MALLAAGWDKKRSIAQLMSSAAEGSSFILLQALARLQPSWARHEDNTGNQEQQDPFPGGSIHVPAVHLSKLKRTPIKTETVLKGRSPLPRPLLVVLPLQEQIHQQILLLLLLWLLVFADCAAVGSWPSTPRDCLVFLCKVIGGLA
jgi:hypothetical protein